jgi:hypothetical protein
VDVLRRHPGRTSAAAGVIVTLLLIEGNLRSLDAVGLALALVVGLVFGVSMFVGMRTRIRRS